MTPQVMKMTAPYPVQVQTTATAAHPPSTQKTRNKGARSENDELNILQHQLKAKAEESKTEDPNPPILSYKQSSKTSKEMNRRNTSKLPGMNTRSEGERTC